MMKITLSLIVIVLLSISTFASTSSDTPEQGEAFKSFFARLTRGGHFPGIYITPSQLTQEAFLKKIKKGYWVGLNDQAIKKLSESGVNVWQDWYPQENPFQVILNTHEKAILLANALNEQIKLDQLECVPACPSADSIIKSSWHNLDSFAKQKFVKAFVFRSALFNNKTLMQILGEVYHYPSQKVIESTNVHILSNAKFISAVRELGYSGEIYFRGITSPDPKDSNKHIILLDEENLFKYSPFDYTVLKTLEIVGVLTHELSHVFQDVKGKSLGYDIEVTSAEKALLIEGSAEYLAEEAMTAAANQETAASSLGLFTTEQAVEIVYREGNSSSGNLFPYTVGLPFAASLYSQVGPSNHEILTVKILEFLGSSLSLEEWLQQDLFTGQKLK